MILLANTYFSRFRRLQGNEVKRCMAFVDDFQRNPANPGISLERVDGAKDPNLWSGRITQDLRAILHKDEDVWTLLYADHHDDAYKWAENRQVQLNQVTGALQIVVPSERVESLIAAQSPSGSAKLFASHKDDYLLSLGLPPEWLPTIRKIDSEEMLLEASEDLPEEAAERLLKLADGKLVTPPTPAPEAENPDTLRRFFIVEDNEDFQSVLHEPMASWIAFLHPSQRDLATGDFDGPVMVTGTAGTGKSVVALHRARHLARQGCDVLLTSYVTTLCSNLEHQLSLFCTENELDKIDVSTLHSTALAVVREKQRATPIKPKDIHEQIDDFNQLRPSGFENAFLHSEWDNVIEEQAISSWDHYRSASREGLSHPLSVAQRKQVWNVFERVIENLEDRNLLSYSRLCSEAARLLDTGEVKCPCDAIVVDETQDLGAQELTLVAAIGRKCSRSDGLMLVGDGGQRIYARGHSLHDYGIDVRGRSRTLKINYRTTSEIRKQANKVRSTSCDALEDGEFSVKGTRDLLHGPDPVFQEFDSGDEQAEFVASEIAQRLELGAQPESIAVFSRTHHSLGKVEKALEHRQIGAAYLRDTSMDRQEQESIKLGTMHRAKGLEFMTVFVIDVNSSLLPHPSAHSHIDDDILRNEAVERERNLLYVSLTRARDELFVTWSGQPSSFLSTIIETQEIT